MSHPDSNQFRLHVLGTPDLRAPDGRRVMSVLSQPKRLGLLTYLALAPEPVSRASLVALFWPESSETRARNALSQAVFHLRRSLDERVVRSVEGDRLWAPPEHLWCDARAGLDGTGGAAPTADAAIGGGISDSVDADAESGELLEGWNAYDSEMLQEWLDAQRRKLRARGGSSPAPARASQPTPPPAPIVASASERFGTPGDARIARLLWVAALVVLAGLVFTVSLATDGRRGAEVTSPPSLAVLMPQISATADAPEIDPAAVHAEILASLPNVDGLRIVSANYATSLQDFRRQLAALGLEAPDVPRWILEVSVRVTRDEARAIGLLHRSPEFDLPGRVSFDVTHLGAESAAMEAPQEVALGVSRMVAQVLAEAGPGA